MGHNYRIYEVDRDGLLHNTGKTVSVVTMPIFNYRGLCSRGSIVEDLFAVFGFTQYSASYGIEISGTNSNDFNITYRYHCGDMGVKPTWYLEKGT